MNASFREARLHDGTQAAVSIVFPDGMDLEPVHVEHQPIVPPVRRGNLAHGCMNRRFCCLSRVEKIEVSRGSVLLADPDRKEHRALSGRIGLGAVSGTAVTETARQRSS